MAHYTLDAARPVLVRPDGTVQIGWDPRRAILVHPPAGLTTTALADVLRRMQTGITAADLTALALDRGAVDAGDVDELVASLARHRLLRTTTAHLRSASVRIHGRGPLSDLIAGALRCSGTRVRHSSFSHAGVRAGTTDLAVLTDYLAADPQVVRDLHDAKVPHLAVRVRDGTGLIGPLVLPGRTSCLRCADLHRSDRDEAWPAVAAQLRHSVGTADRATVLATAALALHQVDRIVAAVRSTGDAGSDDAPPPTLDTTWEFDVATGSTTTRRWTRHPRCDC